MDQIKRYIFLTPILGLLGLFLPFISLGSAGNVSYIEASYAVLSGLDQIITIVVMIAYILINLYLIYLMYKRASLTTVITFSVIDILLLLVYTFFFFFKISDFVAIADLVNQHAGIHWLWFVIVIILNLAVPFAYPFMPAKSRVFVSKKRTGSADQKKTGSSAVAALKKAAAKKSPIGSQSKGAPRENVPIKPRTLPVTAEKAQPIQTSSQPIKPRRPVSAEETASQSLDVESGENSQEKLLLNGFEGQIEALNGEHKGQVLPLIQKTRIFFELTDNKPVSTINPDNAFISIFYIPEYEEYAIDVNSLDSVFLKSGQALGTRGTYYLPRGTQLKILDDLYLLS